jgi:glyceraldehyde 3-phosphate dehydrogenase
LFEDKLGIESGFIETTHAATATQNIHDKGNEKAESKKRGSFDSMIPTSTGAPKAIGLVINSKDGGKIPLDGKATRVPTSNGSMAVMTLKLKDKTTVDDVKEILQNAENDPAYKNLIAKAPMGSTSRDVVGRIESGLYVPESLTLVNGDLLSIKVYYDNEFGYTRSLATLVNKVGELDRNA